MRIEAKSIDEYVSKAPEERKEALKKLRETINKNLPKGFAEELNYGMPGYVVPLSEYPDGYHCKKDTPLPFINFANQKNFIAFYHMGIYANPELLQWFQGEYPKHVKTKLDMGKSCIRFKKPDQIPYELIGELVQKMSMQEWVDLYEANFLKHKK